VTSDLLNSAENCQAAVERAFSSNLVYLSQNGIPRRFSPRHAQQLPQEYFCAVRIVLEASVIQLYAHSRLPNREVVVGVSSEGTPALGVKALSRACLWCRLQLSFPAKGKGESASWSSHLAFVPSS